MITSIWYQAVLSCGVRFELAEDPWLANNSMGKVIYVNTLRYLFAAREKEIT